MRSSKDSHGLLASIAALLSSRHDPLAPFQVLLGDAKVSRVLNYFPVRQSCERCKPNVDADWLVNRR